MSMKKNSMNFVVSNLINNEFCGSRIDQLLIINYSLLTIIYYHLPLTYDPQTLSIHTLF